MPPRLPTLSPFVVPAAWVQWEGRNLDQERETDDGKAVETGHKHVSPEPVFFFF